MTKSKAMVAGLLAAALGFVSTAQAQGWQPQQGQRQYQHDHHRDAQVRSAPQWQGQRQYAPQYQGRAWDGYRAYGDHRGYGGYRGGYAAYARPHHYRAYDWRARHWSAPPYGYQWVEDDSGEVLLMALATGLIANAIVNQAAAPAPYYSQPYYAPQYREGSYPY